MVEMFIRYYVEEKIIRDSDIKSVKDFTEESQLFDFFAAQKPGFDFVSTSAVIFIWMVRLGSNFVFYGKEIRNFDHP